MPKFFVSYEIGARWLAEVEAPDAAAAQRLIETAPNDARIRTSRIADFGRRVQAVMEAGEPLFDVSELAGHLAVAPLSEILNDNRECPLPTDDEQALRDCRIGHSVLLGIGGGGAVAVKRIG